MSTRKHVHEIELAERPERVFEILHTPSAICKWWGAARAIVIPRKGGCWAAAWGSLEDDPDYVRRRPSDPSNPRELSYWEVLFISREKESCRSKPTWSPSSMCEL